MTYCLLPARLNAVATHLSVPLVTKTWVIAAHENDEQLGLLSPADGMSSCPRNCIAPSQALQIGQLTVAPAACKGKPPNLFNAKLSAAPVHRKLKAVPPISPFLC